LYWQQLKDAASQRWKDEIVSRSVEYFFRTEKLRYSRTRRIISLALNVDVASRGETPEDLFAEARAIIDPRLWPDFYTGDIPVEVIDGTGELII
jgi:hypothetical protein